MEWGGEGCVGVVLDVVGFDSFTYSLPASHWRANLAIEVPNPFEHFELSSNGVCFLALEVS